MRPVINPQLNHINLERIEGRSQVSKAGTDTLGNSLRSVARKEYLLLSESYKQLQAFRCQILHLVNHEIVHFDLARVPVTLTRFYQMVHKVHLIIAGVLLLPLLIAEEYPIKLTAFGV